MHALKKRACLSSHLHIKYIFQMKKYCIVILLLLINIALIAQEGCLEMGMQIFPPQYYGTSYPFVNIMKNANSWRTKNAIYINDGQNEWDTGFIDQIPLDENGYPLQLPITINDPNAETDQIVFTQWSAANTLPAGNYVILYDGEGEINISGDGVSSIISDAPGRIEYSFDPTAQYADYLELTINASTLGNHIRNIRVLLPGTEATHQTQPWAASWRDKLAPFKTIRFMEFAQVNGSVVSHWDERTPVDYYTYGADESHGVPYEWMIQLCNETQSNAWINIPHLADENYIVQLANLFKNNLDPNLKIYIEYSNETWNWLFDQTYYLDSIGDQSLNWPERTVAKIGWALETWTNAFGDDPNRVVRVLASQGAWFDIGDRQYAQMETEGTAQYVDAIAVGAYLPINASLLNANSTPADILENSHEAAFGNNNSFYNPLKKYANLAVSKNKKLLFYEGGQHFTPDPFGTVQPYNQALMDVQTDPGIYGAYVELFDSIRALIPGEMLFVHHLLVSPKNGQYGSWGSLENQFSQNAPYNVIAPKYQVLLDNLNGCGSILPIDTDGDGIPDEDDPCPFDPTNNCDPAPTEYCDAAGEEAYYEWVQSIEFNGYINDSGNDWGYADFTDLMINMNIGETISFVLTPGFLDDAYEENWSIWIDLNQDGDFEDTDELLYVSNIPSDGILTDSFNLPAGAMTGNTWMRVAMSNEVLPPPCGNFEYGEVEDYTVNISADQNPTMTTNVPQYTASGFSEMNIYPNPASDYINLDFETPASGKMEITVTDVLGRKLIESNIEKPAGKNSLRLDVQKLKSGQYFLLMDNAGRKTIKPFVIE